MGHLDQELSNIQSTKKTLPTTTYLLEKETDIPGKNPGNRLTYGIYIAAEEITGKIYIYQTGQFPVKSTRENSYIMVKYD